MRKTSRIAHMKIKLAFKAKNGFLRIKNHFYGGNFHTSFFS
jgi:hypothetical protein